MSDFYNKYPYTDFHELNLDWVIERVKKLTEDWAATLEEWNSTEEQWQQLYDYVHDYFDNLDVQQEINNKINAMIADGTFVTITTPVIEAKVASMMPSTVASQIGDTVASQIGNTVAGQLPGVVSAQIGAAVVDPVETWLAAHITQPTTPVIDNSLTISNAGADSFVTGTRLKSLSDSSAGEASSLPTMSGYWDTSDGLYKTFTSPLHCTPKFYVQPNSKIKIANTLTTIVYVLYYDKTEIYTGYIIIYPGATVILPDDAEIAAFNYYNSENLSRLNFYLINENIQKTDLHSESIKTGNYFNGHYLSGIQDHSNGDRYGSKTANASYIITDLIPTRYFNTLYALADFAASKTLSIIYFDKDLKVVDYENKLILIRSSFPATAKYFCICVHIDTLSTLMIYDRFTDHYITDNILSSDNLAKIKYQRLEHGQLTGRPNQTVGSAVYPVDTSITNIYCSYPFSVENISKLSYTNKAAQKLLIYADISGNVLSTVTINAYTKGTLAVPASAVFALYYTGLTGDPETQFTVVAGEDLPDHIYDYNAITIENLDVSTDYLSGKTIVFDGDSITQGAGVTDISTGIAPNNNKGWAYWVQQNHPASVCYGFGQSGWTVGRRTGYTDSLLNHIPSYPATVDLFVLSGGYNDQAVQMAMGDLVAVTDGADAYFNATFDEDTFIGALESWFQQLRAGYPFAKIVYVLTPQRIYHSDPVFNLDTKGQQVRGVLYSSGKERMDLFWEKIRTVCDKWSIKYLDLSKECGVVGTGETTDPGLTIGTRYYQTSGGIPDFTHPNTNFYKEMIVPLIENLIQTVMPK